MLPTKTLTAPKKTALSEIITTLSTDLDQGIDKVSAVLAMRMNQYSDIELSEEEATNLKSEFLNIELGASTGLVLICSKDKCLYKDRCALFRTGKLPLKKECVHENKVLTDAMGKYITSLNIELDNYSEMVLVNQLVEYELIEHRCNAILSNLHADMRMRSIIGLDKEGNIVEKEDISYALSIKMQVIKLKMDVLRDFTATRRETYKKQAALKQASDGPTKIMSSLKKQLNSIKSADYLEVESNLEVSNALGDIDEY